MNRKIKLIWDFKGPTAKQTAEHHKIHLKEYAQNEKLTLQIVGTETINEMHSIAFLVVTEIQMKIVRDALKPHRGQLYED